MNQGHILLNASLLHINTYFMKLYVQLIFPNKNIKTDKIVMHFSNTHRTKFLLQHEKLCKLNTFLPNICLNTDVKKLLFPLVSKLIRESILVSQRDFPVSIFFQWHVHIVEFGHWFYAKVLLSVHFRSTRTKGR